MKPRMSNKMLVQLSLASTLVVLAAILVYLGSSGRPAPTRSGIPNQVAGRPPAPPTAPTSASPAPTATPSPQSQTTPPGGKPAGGAPKPTGGGTPPAGTPQSQTTPAGGKPSSGAPAPTGTGVPPAPGAGQPAPATKPGGATSSTPGSTGATGSAPAASPTKPQDPEAAVVGSGPQGRSDPFAPLASPESQRALPAPVLPPPPGVGLPMPPGFGAPGGPSAAPSPGAGMRVTGIMGSRTRVAIIEADGQTHVVGVGERVRDAVVVSILPEKVIMREHNVTFELGFGGERSS